MIVFRSKVFVWTMLGIWIGFLCAGFLLQSTVEKPLWVLSSKGFSISLPRRFLEVENVSAGERLMLIKTDTKGRHICQFNRHALVLLIVNEEFLQLEVSLADVPSFFKFFSEKTKWNTEPRLLRSKNKMTSRFCVGASHVLYTG